MALFDIIYPRFCLECGRNGAYICEECLLKVNRAEPVCPSCGRATFNLKTHERCLYPFGLDGLYSIWEYKGVVRKAILALKYKFATDIAEELSFKTLQQIKKFPFPGYTLLPIPIHKKRGRWRGFNQTEVLGEFISKNLGLEFKKDLLVRKRQAKPQTELKGYERVENIKGVFEVIGRKIPSKALLFDDVWTTGSTLKEAAKVLKEGGSKEVFAFTLAKRR